MDHLERAQDTLKGFSGKAADLQLAQTYAAVALAEGVREIVAKLGLLNSNLGSLLGQGQGQDAAAKAEADVAKAEASVVKPKVAQRKASQKQ